MEDFDFSWGQFWVQLTNVPFKLMNDKVGRDLGLKVGFVEEIEAPKFRISWGHCLRARFRVGVSTPVKRMLVGYF